MNTPNTVAINDRAFELLDSGDKQGAKTLFEQVCSLDSQNSEATLMIGVIQAEEGDFTSAEKNLRQALVLDPEYADAFYYLANVQQARGQMAAALTNVKRAIELDPDFAEAGKLLARLQQLPENTSGFQASNLAGNPRCDPTNNQAKETLSVASQQLFDQANALLQQGKLAEVAKCYETVTEQQPELAVGWFMLGRTRAQLTQYSEAERCCLHAIQVAPELVEAHLMLASIFLMKGKTEQAYKYSDAALRLAPADINAVALSANIAKHMGDPEKAYALLSPLLSKGVKQINIALAFAMISKDLDRQQQAINLMEDILESDKTLSASGKSNLHFNLGALYDSLKQYDLAFEHYEQGNKLKTMPFDRQQHALMIDRQIAAYSVETLANLPRSTIASQRPVFIVGMVRSGTSLVEQILSSHADVYGAGELADIYQFSNNLSAIIGTNINYPECISQISQTHVDDLSQRYLDRLLQISPDASRVTDKLPGNFMYLGLIQLLFPDARIIHCIRHPADTCLSAYFQDFSSNHPYAYDFKNLGAYYQDYLKLMMHWRKVLTLPMLEINYEDLIEDQEPLTRKLVAFCGLPWDESCLQFHKSQRFVRTASYDQVNRPLYKQSVARWKNYEKHIGPLLNALKE